MYEAHYHFNEPCQPSPKRNLRNTLIGLVFVVAGIFIMGHRMGFISHYLFHAIISWQMLLIAIGVIQLLTKRNKTSGVILILIGSFFIMPQIFIVPCATCVLPCSTYFSRVAGYF
jgi:uncharacterized membrane protein HdeD (DUF308 family)